MWRWQSLAIGVIAAGVTAQVLAEDTARPDRPNNPQQAAQARPAEPESMAPPGLPRSPQTDISGAQAAQQSGRSSPPSAASSAPTSPTSKIAGPNDPGTTALGPVVGPAPQSMPHKPDAGVVDRPAWDREIAPQRVSAHRPRYTSHGGSRYRSRYAGSNWPIDQNRRFEGPRDAFGGHWIYVRPARRPAARYYGRYGTKYAQHDDRGYAPRRSSNRYQPQFWGDQRPYAERDRTYPRYD